MLASLTTRSALIAWGRNPPPELAYLTCNERGDRRVVTWTEVIDNRRKWQAERLAIIRRGCATRHAYRFEVRYFDMPLMGGWQSALDDWRGEPYGTWPDRDLKWFKPLIMQAIPLGLLPLGSEGDQWAAWKIEFAHKFKRRMRDGRPMGVAYIWWDESDSVPELIRKAAS